MTYEDEKGRRYMVMPAVIKTEVVRYKAMFRQPGRFWLQGVPKMPWRDTVMKAQQDLDELAKRKGWVAV